MSATSVARKGTVRGNESKRRSGYMTTTELARLCGVSRFTIINWTKQGRIKAISAYGENLSISHCLKKNRLVNQTEKRPAEVYPDTANKARNNISLSSPLYQPSLLHTNPIRKRVSSFIFARSGLGRNKILWQTILRKITYFGSVNNLVHTILYVIAN